MATEDLGGPITGEGSHTPDEYRRQTVELQKADQKREDRNAKLNWIIGALILAFVLSWAFTRGYRSQPFPPAPAAQTK